MGASKLTQGTIEMEYIVAARKQMYQMVHSFLDIKERINTTTEKVKSQWVGRGRDEFETQYKLLVAKIGDLGDSLDEMYNAVVDAEAADGGADEDMRQSMTMASQ